MIDLMMSGFTVVAKVISLVVSCATYVALSRRLEKVERQLDNLSNGPQPLSEQDVAVGPRGPSKQKPQFVELTFGNVSPARPSNRERPCKRRGIHGRS
jgi:hypothetical protein